VWDAGQRERTAHPNATKNGSSPWRFLRTAPHRTASADKTVKVWEIASAEQVAVGVGRAGGPSLRSARGSAVNVRVPWRVQ